MEYSTLKPEQKTELEECFASFTYEIQKQNLIPLIRDKIARYEVDGRKELLGKILAWVQPTESQAVEILTIRDLNIQYPKAYLTDEKDIDEYLKLLREAMAKAVFTNKRIQL